MKGCFQHFCKITPEIVSSALIISEYTVTLGYDIWSMYLYSELAVRMGLIFFANWNDQTVSDGMYCVQVKG